MQSANGLEGAVQKQPQRGRGGGKRGRQGRSSRESQKRALGEDAASTQPPQDAEVLGEAAQDRVPQ